MTNTTPTQTTEKKRYHFTLLDNGTKAKWEIHRQGCPDIKRKLANKNHFPVRSLTAKGAATFLRSHWLDAETRELGYTDSDVEIMGCATNQTGEAI